MFPLIDAPAALAEMGEAQHVGKRVLLVDLELGSDTKFHGPYLARSVRHPSFLSRG
jgi:hypothetical protein